MLEMNLDRESHSPDESSRSARPPQRAYYVVWGRGRLNRSRLYRDRGWAKRQAERLSAQGQYVRVYESEPIRWNEYHAFSGVDNTSAQRRLAWANGQRWRLALLNMEDEIPIARVLREHPRVDELANRCADVARRSLVFLSRVPAA